MNTPTPLLRGAALVDAVMAHRRAHGESFHGADPDSLSERRLGNLPLTPTLKRWYECDDDFFLLGEPRTFNQLVEEEFPEWSDAFGLTSQLLGSGHCFLFEGWGSDSRRFLYLGKPDSEGEYPVFTLDTDDVPFVCLNGPIDVWLAQQAGYLAEEKHYGFVPTEYLACLQEHAELNFGGHTSLEDGFPEGAGEDDLRAIDAEPHSSHPPPSLLNLMAGLKRKGTL
jgi:hypothetical protein